MTMPSRILLSRSHIFRLWRSVGWPYHIIRKSMISDCGCLEFAKQFWIKKGRVNISLVSVLMVRALVHSLSLASAIRKCPGRGPILYKRTGIRNGPIRSFWTYRDRKKWATTVATDSSSPLLCSFGELGYCGKCTSIILSILWKTSRFTRTALLPPLIRVPWGVRKHTRSSRERYLSLGSK
jgi:hypothetical protein